MRYYTEEQKNVLCALLKRHGFEYIYTTTEGIERWENENRYVVNVKKVTE